MTKIPIVTALFGYSGQNNNKANYDQEIFAELFITLNMGIILMS
ncbi:hypothetical protein RINTHM_5670 [Richelia intracellularis HM01]|nr:hypothetical protein RINTHM_5670 [Richelia intracellularis HM01]